MEYDINTKPDWKDFLLMFGLLVTALAFISLLAIAGVLVRNG